MTRLAETLNELIFTRGKTYHEIMIFLYNKNTPMKTWRISREIGKPPGIIGFNLGVLQDMGLVNKNRAKSRGLDSSLTDKGREVARMLREMKNLMRECDNGK